jgi:hypothetical protein
VQFATQQSEPVSILYDTEFKDPGLPTATFADTSGWHYTGDAHMVYDTVNKALKVTRNPDLIRTLIGTNNPVIHPPVTPVFTAAPTWTTTLNQASQGGIASGQVPVSPGGALHLAVRLTPLQTLSQPLYLQLIGSDGTTVLSETPFTPQPNTPTEQTMHYLLGQQPALESAVEIRCVQKGAARDEWLMHSFALFDDSVLWEFSNDGGITWQPAVGIRNNADGVLRFPALGCGLRFRLTCYRYNTSVSMVKIKPWYTGRALGRHALPQRGANLSNYDDELQIHI